MKMARIREYKTIPRYVLTPLTEYDALTQHFAHKSLFAAGCDHLNFSTGGNVRDW
jgi:hypothetical protein